MTTLTLQSRSSSPAPIILGILFSILIALAVGVAYGHTEERHGYTGLQVRQYCNSNPTSTSNFIDPTGRMIQICQLERNVYGLRVLEKINGKWEEITAYVKDGMRNGNDVTEFVRNRSLRKVMEIVK